MPVPTDQLAVAIDALRRDFKDGLEKIGDKLVQTNLKLNTLETEVKLLLGQGQFLARWFLPLLVTMIGATGGGIWFVAGLNSEVKQLSRNVQDQTREIRSLISKTSTPIETPLRKDSDKFENIPKPNQETKTENTIKRPTIDESPRQAPSMGKSTSNVFHDESANRPAVDLDADTKAAIEIAKQGRGQPPRNNSK